MHEEHQLVATRSCVRTTPGAARPACPGESCRPKVERQVYQYGAPQLVD
ncbi:hypothetical protein F444_12721 [Phytophthora nicotianae P1976]|uniref:Uncharacterized protein n=1 Tax=Phytophthora nicotianae P1976 TaxID=1317066 RepID=A0A080ZW30_PHYNI|nr:hypothetical protein F444_12721 [Phytophthora nicotianae P1976]